MHYTRTNIHLGTYIHCCPCMLHVHQHTHQIHTNVILNNLPRTQDTHAGVCRLTHKHAPIHAHAHAHRPPALSGTSLNIHHSGCSESAVNAASHSRESLKPTLSSALPPSFPSLRRTHTLSHTHLQPRQPTKIISCADT